MKEKRLKTNKNNKSKIIVIILIIIFVSIYFLLSTIKLIQQPTDTFVVENGKVSQEETGIGYIIREEQVIQGNNYKNGMAQIKSEGEKVAKGENIFRYYSNNEENLVKNIQELDVKIQEAMEKETDRYSPDIKLLEEQIESKIEEVTKTNDIKKIVELKKDINAQITKKAKMAGDLSPAGSYIRKLIEERTSYETKLNSGAEYITAPESGILSYRVDGLEDVLTYDNFSNLNSQYLENLKLKTGQIVASSSESGKIINNFECYIATSLKSESAKNAKEGQTVTIRLSNAEEVNAKIEKIIQEDETRLIIFKISNEVENLANYRKISLDIIWWSYTGIKVPNSSIIEENDRKYIVRSRMGYTDKILVKVLKTNEHYSIIRNYETTELKEELGYDSTSIRQNKNIMLYDEILIKPKE